MGFFSKHRSRIINPDPPIPRGTVPPGPFHAKPNSQSVPSKFDIAMEYFHREQIQCSSSTDRETIERVYASLKEKNHNTYDDDSLIDALSTLDVNVYHLSNAIILQNFMLMRKVDALSERVKNLESKLSHEEQLSD